MEEILPHIQTISFTERCKKTFDVYFQTMQKEMKKITKKDNSYTCLAIFHVISRLRKKHILHMCEGWRFPDSGKHKCNHIMESPAMMDYDLA